MENKELEKRKGCNSRVVLFFIFAIVIIAAFLIIGLVKTCNADHQEVQEDEMIENITSNFNAVDHITLS